MQLKYKYLLIDNDNTLMDFHAAEHAAIRETFSIFNLPADDESAAKYSAINDQLWRDYEQGKVTQQFLKVERFRRFLLHVNEQRDPEMLAEKYAERLGCHAELMPDAVFFLQQLHGHCKIALLTNGVGTIQRSRLSISPITEYLDAVIISGEIGISKPDPQMAMIALQALGCENKKEAVLIGDSLSADIACARNAGIDAVWVNENGEAKNLMEVLNLLKS